jgi:hypothetical protein
MYGLDRFPDRRQPVRSRRNGSVAGRFDRRAAHGLAAQINFNSSAESRLTVFAPPNIV